ncbi:MAG: hypothetical protein AAGJ38_08645 [Planctomycetota bacterium]
MTTAPGNPSDPTATAPSGGGTFYVTTPIYYVNDKPHLGLGNPHRWVRCFNGGNFSSSDAGHLGVHFERDPVLEGCHYAHHLPHACFLLCHRAVIKR